MSWKLDEVNGYMVASETVTTKSGAIVYSSEIDFIPPGVDFQVIGNAASADLSSSTHIEMFVAYESGGTYYRQNTAGFNATTAAIDAAAVVLTWNQSKYRSTSHGQWPYRKLKFPRGGGDVRVVIVYPSLGNAYK